MKKDVLDTADKIILDILQENAKTPLKDIARKVYLSTPAVSARIEKMEKEGIITGYYAQVNPVALGYHIKALINLEVPPEDKKEFYPFVKACSNVIECNCVTGDYSMVLEVLFPSTIELDQFIGELQRFGRTKTLIVFSTSVEHRGITSDIDSKGMGDRGQGAAGGSYGQPV
nr:Lrp/AsnC family transcriptional regulator [Blautia sp. An81]